MWPKRGNTTARGYGNEHQQQRRHWAAVLEATGGVSCARGCGHVIRPHERWHLDHTDDRTTYLGPSCERCNLAAAGRKGQSMQPRRKRVTEQHPGQITHW